MMQCWSEYVISNCIFFLLAHFKCKIELLLLFARCQHYDDDPDADAGADDADDDDDNNNNNNNNIFPLQTSFYFS